MQDRTDLQRDIFHRVLRLHALRSTAESFELLQLAIDDTLIFDLVYSQIMERMSQDGELDIRATQTGLHEVVVEPITQLLFWLVSNRAEILVAIGSVVDALGGIEIASFLIEENDRAILSLSN